MRPTAHFILEHPLISGGIVAALIGVSAWNLYRCGMAVGALRADSAFAASEALGG